MIAELNYFRDATEVFTKRDHAAEGCFSQIVD
jgi:hypothetical protein